MFFSRLLSITIVLTVPFTAAAEVSLFDSRTWLRAKTIQPGQQVWSIQTSYQRITDRFSNSGQPQSLGRPYRRSVTWRQLVESEPSVAGKAELQDFMRARGLRENDIAATASYDVDREDVGFHINWAYGLMSRWMIGFNVPLIHRRTQTRSRVELSSALAANQRARQSSVGVKEKIKKISEEQLANSGYDQVPDEQTSWDWGDISLLSQVLLHQGYQWHWSLQQVLRFPTARNPNLDDYIQTSDDSGQVDVGITSMLDLRLRRWTLGSRLGYVAQLPDNVRARVSEQTEHRKIDPKVARDLGDWWWVSTDVEFKASRRVDLNLEYAYLNKGSDRYRGSAGSGIDFKSFSRNTDQEIHQTRLGMNYLIRSYGARAGIENKWVAAVGYSYPWIGRNSLNASRATIDVINYF